MAAVRSFVATAVSVWAMLLKTVESIYRQFQAKRLSLPLSLRGTKGVITVGRLGTSNVIVLS
jgi:hypothetical protein